MTAISKKKIWSTILKFFSKSLHFLSQPVCWAISTKKILVDDFEIFFKITSLSLTTGMLSDFDKKKFLVDDFEIFFQIN